MLSPLWRITFYIIFSNRWIRWDTRFQALTLYHPIPLLTSLLTDILQSLFRKRLRRIFRKNFLMNMKLWLSRETIWLNSQKNGLLRVSLTPVSITETFMPAISWPQRISLPLLTLVTVLSWQLFSRRTSSEWWLLL